MSKYYDINKLKNTYVHIIYTPRYYGVYIGVLKNEITIKRQRRN